MVNLLLCMATRARRRYGPLASEAASLRRGYGARRKPNRSSLRAEAQPLAGKGSLAFPASELVFAASELAVTRSST